MEESSSINDLFNQTSAISESIDLQFDGVDTFTGISIVKIKNVGLKITVLLGKEPPFKATLKVDNSKNWSYKLTYNYNKRGYSFKRLEQIGALIHKDYQKYLKEKKQMTNKELILESLNDIQAIDIIEGLAEVKDDMTINSIIEEYTPLLVKLVKEEIERIPNKLFDDLLDDKLKEHIKKAVKTGVQSLLDVETIKLIDYEKQILSFEIPVIQQIIYNIVNKRLKFLQKS